MPVITFQIIQKPLEERLIDAACVYWNVEREYFSRNDRRDEIVYRRDLLHYLLKTKTNYSPKEIADRFKFKSRCTVIRGIELIEARRNIYRHIANDIAQVENLAAKLAASFISTTIILVNDQVKVN